ncbi:hypothetical protein [Flavobacterium rhizosphaerae]|uniref:Uncharacterized protein n=1 Tax=Flavobacterium rhizosphaerae TaxID=3163298 RepID=A0ABW8YZ50_9FLAO
MKKNLLRLTKPLISIFIFIILLNSCENDDSLKTNQIVNVDSNGVSSKIISLKDIEGIPGLMDKISQIKSLRNQSNSNQRIIDNKEFDFIIDTDSVLLVQKGSYHSLSFPVYRDEDNHLQENLFLHPYNGGYLAFLMKYNFNSIQLSKINSGISLGISEILNTLQVVPLDEQYTTYGAPTGIIIRGEDGKCYRPNLYEWGWGWIECPGCECPGEGSGSNNSFPGTFTFDVRPWGPSGTGGTTSSIFNPPSSGGGGGSSTPPGQPDIPYPDPSNPSDPTYSLTPIRNIDNGEPIIGFVMPNRGIAVRYINNLQNTYPDFWNDSSNFTTVNKIISFINNNTNHEDYEFAKQAIEVLEDGGDVDFFYKVILDESFTNNLMLKGIYDALGGSATFQNYVQNFDEEFSVAHLKFSVGLDSGNTGALAATYPPDNYIIEIKFNPSYLPPNQTRPDLDIVGTFIHEILHADIFRKLLSVVENEGTIYGFTQGDIENLQDSFPGLYDYYMRYMFGVVDSNLLTDAQHQMMATHYRDIIVDVLKEYDSSKPNELYEAIAWAGLMGSGQLDNSTLLYENSTVAWVNLTFSEREEILNLYINFINGVE